MFAQQPERVQALFGLSLERMAAPAATAPGPTRFLNVHSLLLSIGKHPKIVVELLGHG